MLKGQMLEIGWIVRIFLIVSIIFFVILVSRSALTDMDINIEDSRDRYRSQAAALHVLTSEEKRNVLTDLNENLRTSEHEGFCKGTMPGFRSQEPFYIKKTGPEDPMCGSVAGYNQYPFVKSGQTRPYSFAVLWK